MDSISGAKLWQGFLKFLIVGGATGGISGCSQKAADQPIKKPKRAKKKVAGRPCTFTERMDAKADALAQGTDIKGKECTVSNGSMIWQ
jgi:hypothetical protein